MGFGFNFLFKKEKEEMQELMTEENIILEGNFESTNFISLSGGNPEYIYSEEYSLYADDNDKFVEELAVRSGVDREKAKIYGEKAFLQAKIYMDKKGKIDFILEFDYTSDEILDENKEYEESEVSYGFSEELGRMVRYRSEFKEIDWVMTEREREMLIRKAKEHFDECFGVDLMRLPELVKGCKNKEQLFDKFEAERGKGIDKIAEAYGLENMKVQGYDNESFKYKNNTILACTFRPDFKTSMEIRKEAGLQGKGSVECTAKFDNHMEMSLEVNDGSEKKAIVPKRSLEKEIRAGISAMYEKHKGYSLAEYMFNDCPEVYWAKPTQKDMEYYCKEMRKQKFFNEEMTPDFYSEERLKDWALELLCNYKDYDLTPQSFHRELDYYKYPDMETRLNLLKQLRDYKVDYEEMLEFKASGNFDDFSLDNEELPF